MTRTEIYYDTLEEVVPSNLGVSLIFKGGRRHQSHGSIWVKKEA